MRFKWTFNNMYLTLQMHQKLESGKTKKKNNLVNLVTFFKNGAH